MPLATITKKAQDVYNYVSRIFGDEAAVQVTSADVINWINMGQREIIVSNPVNKATATIDLLSAVNVYDPSSLDILQIQSIWVNGLPVEHKTFQEAEQYIVSQDSKNQARGVPVLWYDWAGNIYVYPAPDNNYVAGLTVFYLKNPAKITALTDTLTVPDQFFNRLCEYVMAQAYELDEDSQNSQFKLGQFQQGLDRQADEQEAQRSYYPTVTVLYEDDDWVY
jgi:hypothetical protein